MCNSVLSMTRNIKQDNNENILNAGCLVHKTLASTQHSCTDGWFSACAWDVIPWTWSSEECFLLFYEIRVKLTSPAKYGNRKCENR